MCEEKPIKPWPEPAITICQLWSSQEQQQMRKYSPSALYSTLYTPFNLQTSLCHARTHLPTNIELYTCETPDALIYLQLYNPTIGIKIDLHELSK